MGQSLAIKYRPKTLEEICGQSITTKILEKAIEQKTEVALKQLKPLK